MNHNELLHAISDIMDQKLEEKVMPQINNLGNRFDNLETRFDGLEARFDGLETRFDDLETSVDDLSGSFSSLDSRVKNIELTLENDVVPRLSHIEQCYIDTFERYQEGVQKLDEMHRDIDVIKLTVTDHSEELNKITGPYLVK